MKRNSIRAILIFLVFLTAGSSLAAQKSITKFSSAGTINNPTGAISFNQDLQDFSAVVSKTGAIEIDLAHKQVNLGGNIYDGHGALWYRGDSDLAYCIAGICDFGMGIRAYFDFKFVNTDNSEDSTNSADGFMFAIVNGKSNDYSRTGGAPAGISIGEMIGYAGPGTTVDKQGLRPPKMAIEIDTYPNAAKDVCGAGSRNDSPLGSSFRNHIAQVFWGDRTIAGACSTAGINYPKSSYDDNRHGAGGTGDDPDNASNPSSGYYQGHKNGSYNWLEDGELHNMRIEIDRSDKPAGGGSGLYKTKVWIDCKNCTDDELKNYKDITQNFTDKPPRIDTSSAPVELSATDHRNMDRILFGFTEATGGKTQIVHLTNFKIFFPKTCTYTISPGSISISPSSYSGSIALATSNTACPWTASSDSSWITITAGSSGNGSGTIFYDVQTNPGAGALPRTGHINVMGKIFTVYQSN